MTQYVLIHGANYDSSCWRYLVPHLDGSAVLVDLPGRGRRPAPMSEVTPAQWVDAAAEDVEAAKVQDGVLVAHSAGGLTASHLLLRMADRFRAVVLVACPIAPHGGAMIDSIDPEIRDGVMAGSGDGTYILGEEMARTALCNDLNEEMSAVVMNEMLSDSTSFLAEPFDLSAIQQFPSVKYIRTTKDATLPPEHQSAAAAAIGNCKIVDIDTGHMAMLSNPEKLARLIREAGES